MQDTPGNRLIAERCANPDGALLHQIKVTQWTSHNFHVTRFDSTMDVTEQKLVGDLVKTRTIKKSIHRFLGRNGDVSGLRLIDLGCLEGGISLEMARENLDVVGVEGRESNYLKCKLVEDYFRLPNLRFLHQDVKTLSAQTHGTFDVVLCLGLLYHLDAPVDFLRQINEMTRDGGLMFIDTHFAPQDEEALDACLFKNSLSELGHIEQDGKTYEGRWFKEYEEEAQGSNDAWAAVSNHRSFWPTEDSLLRALYVSGFRDIYALHGNFEIEKEFKSRREYSRAWYVAIK